MLSPKNAASHVMSMRRFFVLSIQYAVFILIHLINLTQLSPHPNLLPKGEKGLPRPFGERAGVRGIRNTSLFGRNGISAHCPSLYPDRSRPTAARRVAAHQTSLSPSAGLSHRPDQHRLRIPIHHALVTTFWPDL